MSKKDRIFRVLSIVLLMTMLLFSFGCAGQESLSEINSSAISSDVSDVSENPSVSSTETEGTSTETQVLTRSHPPLIQRVPLPRRQV